MSSLKENIDHLPPDLRKEAEDFVEYLLYKKEQRKPRKLKLNWAGALKDYRNQFTATELEEEANKWRME